MTEIWGLIPARSGSKRVKNKNIRLLGGKPLIQWTMEAALESKVFDKIIVTSDIKDLPRLDGIEYFDRKAGLGELDPDIEWIQEILSRKCFDGQDYPDNFAILRPTSPFRDEIDIRSAFMTFNDFKCDSLRAIKQSQNPFKMWRVGMESDPFIIPAFYHSKINGDEIYNCPSQHVRSLCVQCGAIEMAKTKNVFLHDNVSGINVIPHFMDEINGFDINTEFDFMVAEALIESGKIKL